MWQNLESVIFWASLVIPVMGLVVAILTRLTEGRGYQQTCQRCFFVILIAAAAATLATIASGEGSWVVCGSTVSLMSVAATVDFTRTMAVPQM